MRINLIESTEFNTDILKDLQPLSFFSNSALIAKFHELFEGRYSYLTYENEGRIQVVVPVVRNEWGYESTGRNGEQIDLFDYLPIFYSSIIEIQNFLSQLYDYSHSNNILVVLRDVPTQIVRRLDQRRLQGRLEYGEEIPICNISRNPTLLGGTIIFKKKHRKEIKRKINRIEGTGMNIRFEEEISKVENTDIFLDFFRNSGNSEKKEFYGVKTSEFLKTFIQQERVKLSGMYLGEKLVSILIFFEEEKKRLLYNMASDVEMYDYSPGIIHTYNLILSTIKKGYDEFSFLRGGERYKSEVGANSCERNYTYFTN